MRLGLTCPLQCLLRIFVPFGHSEQKGHSRGEVYEVK